MRKNILFFCLLFIICGCSKQEESDSEQIKNIMTFARLYGYVKYFHPSSEAQSIDWNNFAIYGVREILKAKNQEEAENILKKIFSPIAPSLTLYRASSKDSIITVLNPNDSTNIKIVYWMHRGDGREPNTDTLNVYRSILRKNNYSEKLFAEDSIKFGDVVSGSLENGLRFKLPIALYYNQTEDFTYPKVDVKELNPLKKALFEESANPFSFEDNAYAIANVIIAWNVIEHFFPYMDLTKEVSSGRITREEYWKEKLKLFISSAINVKSENEQSELLERLVACLEDGHGTAFNVNSNEYFYPPFIVDKIQDSIVVVEVKDNEKDIMPGDIILKINNENIDEIIKRNESLVSAATIQLKNHKIIKQELLRGKRESELKISFLRNGNLFKKKFFRNSSPFEKIDNPENQGIKELKDNIFYVSLITCNYEDFMDKINLLENAKGVIFDLRGYPQRTYSSKKSIENHPVDFLRHLTLKEINSMKWMIPIVTRPDYLNIRFDSSGIWSLTPLFPKLNGEIIFLTNERAISFSETLMSLVENYNLGEIIGSTTAGTNGNINWITLLGDFKVIYTGMKVLKNDGSLYHGVGVKPTIPVEKTIKGIREGRDEVLEKAIEVIEKN